MGVLQTIQASSDQEEDIETLDDSSLIARAKDDRLAFGELYRRYVERIYNYVYYRVGNRQDAEDLTARTFHRALRHIENYQDKGVPFAAWLYRIARNLVANWHRDRSRWQVITLEEIAHFRQEQGSPEALLQMIENEQMLLAAVRRLPADRQELLVLKFLHRLSNAEIGLIMGRTEGAVKSLYHRTLLALRDDLDPTAAQTSTGKTHKERFWRRARERS